MFRALSGAPQVRDVPGGASGGLAGFMYSWGPSELAQCPDWFFLVLVISQVSVHRGVCFRNVEINILTLKTHLNVGGASVTVQR